MRRTIAAILLCVSSTNLSAQNVESALWPELAIYSVYTEKVLKLIKESSSLVEDKLGQSQQLQAHASNKECLGGLQLLSMGAAVIANVMPFSSVHLKEGEVGPTGRYRLLLNGEKVHFTAFCDDASLRVEELDWEDMDIAGYTPFEQETFDAAIGAMILAYVQGIFDGEEETGVSESNKTDDGLESLLDSALETPEALETRETVEPLTLEEKAAINFRPCWVIDPGARYSRVSVTVDLELTPDGKVAPSSMKLTSFEGGTEADARVAFQNVRRAILRCQKDGYDLPKDKYEQWRYVSVTADPQNMRRE